MLVIGQAIMITSTTQPTKDLRGVLTFEEVHTPHDDMIRNFT